MMSSKGACCCAPLAAELPDIEQRIVNSELHRLY
jgi:hypothetical protein